MNNGYIVASSVIIYCSIPDTDHLPRFKSDIHIRTANITYGQMSLIIYKGGTLWNSLPRNLKIIQAASQFKSKLMHHLRSFN